MRMLKTISLSCLFLTGLGFTVLGLLALEREVGWAGTVGEHHWAQIRVSGGNVMMTHAHRGRTPNAYRRGVRLLRGDFGTLSFSQGSDRRWRWVSVTAPLWLAVGGLVIPSGIGLVNGPIRRRRRLRKGQCETCGYDLYGCVGERCPECGADRPLRLPCEADAKSLSPVPKR